MKTMKEYISTAEGMAQMWEKINEILDNFDFGKVLTTMEALDWYWACTEGDADLYADQGCKIKAEGSGLYYRPELPQLLKAARKRLIDAIESMPDGERRFWTDSGGFKVSVYISTDEERSEYYGSEVANVDDFAHSVDLTLEFIVADYTTIY